MASGKIVRTTKGTPTSSAIYEVVTSTGPKATEATIDIGIGTINPKATKESGSPSGFVPDGIIVKYTNLIPIAIKVCELHHISFDVFVQDSIREGIHRLIDAPIIR